MRHVITDFGRLADDHAGGVVYEHALAEHGSRMDVDPCEQARQAPSTPRARNLKSFCHSQWQMRWLQTAWTPE